jgi:hypothetical protein
MEEKELQKQEKEEQESQEIPKGFYLTEIPTQFVPAIALGDKVVDTNQLLVLMANALKEAGLIKI